MEIGCIIQNEKLDQNGYYKLVLSMDISPQHTSWLMKMGNVILG